MSSAASAFLEDAENEDQKIRAPGTDFDSLVVDQQDQWTDERLLGILRTLSVDIDYIQQLDDLSIVRKSLTDDKAFWPTTIVYSLTFVTGLIGNLLVVFSLTGDRRRRSLHSVTAVFLVSLVMADLVLLTNAPYEVAARFTGHWPFGAALCKLSGFIEMLSSAAAVWNLTAVSVERYIVIVHPMKARLWCTLGAARKVIVIVWVVSILLSSPQLHVMDTRISLYYNNETSLTRHTCMDSNVESRAARIAFSWYQLVVLFCLPVGAMSYCYTVVTRVLWNSTKQLAKMTNSLSEEGDCRRSPSKKLLFSSTTTTAASCPSSRSTRTTNRHVSRGTAAATTPAAAAAAVGSSTVHGDGCGESRKQVIKMLMVIIVVFFLCWAPGLILTVMKRHELSLLYTDSAFFIMVATRLLPFIHSSTNPIIYALMSNNFKRSLRMACRTCCCCCCCSGGGAYGRGSGGGGCSRRETRSAAATRKLVLLQDCNEMEVIEESGRRHRSGTTATETNRDKHNKATTHSSEVISSFSR